MHEDEIHDKLLQACKYKFYPIGSQDPFTTYAILAKSFKGTITQSTLNVHPNKWCHATWAEINKSLAKIILRQEEDSDEDVLRADFVYRSSTYVDKDQYVDQYLPSVVG